MYFSEIGGSSIIHLLKMMWIKFILILTVGIIISFRPVKYAKSQNISESINHPQTEALDWNLYELNKQQVLEYENIEKHKDNIIKEIDLLEKKAKAEADLEDKFEYLYHDILKRESDASRIINNEQESKPHRMKRSIDRRLLKSITTINGGWSPWSNVATPCNATCGGGKMIRRRSCTNPTPQVLFLLKSPKYLYYGNLGILKL